MFGAFRVKMAPLFATIFFKPLSCPTGRYCEEERSGNLFRYLQTKSISASIGFIEPNLMQNISCKMQNRHAKLNGFEY